ncbi:MAG: hypothetical protein Q9M19_01055 [Mariprofundaceae bacterium]|nr:hypothetical protein [Mariprofundaceae bacterium]
MAKYDHFPTEVTNQDIAVYTDTDIIAVASGNNQVLAIGAMYAKDDDEDEEKGAVGIYRLVDDIWELDRVFADQGGHDGDMYGSSIALSHDGNTMAIGAPKATVDGEEKQGKVDLYTHNASDGSWTEINTFYPPDTTVKNRFGTSIVMSPDATVIGIGSYKTPVPNTDSLGVIYVQSLDGAGQVTSVDVITPPTDAVYEDFGRHISLAPDTGALVVTADNMTTGDGVGNVITLSNQSEPTPTVIAGAAGSTVTVISNGVSTSGWGQPTPVPVIEIYRIPPKVKFDAAITIAPDGLSLTVDTNTYTGMFPARGMIMQFNNVGGVWVDVT